MAAEYTDFVLLADIIWRALQSLSALQLPL